MGGKGNSFNRFISWFFLRPLYQIEYYKITVFDTNFYHQFLNLIMLSEISGPQILGVLLFNVYYVSNILEKCISFMSGNI